MAIFNYANNLEEVKDYIGIASGTNNYLKLLFTGDGHIISHGFDYTPDFAPGKRGLVSGATGRKSDFLRGTHTWGALTTTDLPIVTSLTGAEDDEHIPTTKAVVEYIGTFTKAAETLRFKGVINYENGKYQVAGADYEGFPVICQVGDSYRIGTNAFYAGTICEPGDMLICIKNNNDTNVPTNSSEYWTVIQTNINGTKLTTINGDPHYFYSNAADPITFFAPKEVGNYGDILISLGNKAPVWAQISFIDGNLVATDNNGDLQLSIPVSASNIVNSLSIGVGLSLHNGNSGFDGSIASTLNLMKATTTTLGGIKIDTDHGYDNTATISMDIDGTLYITAENIANALGYDVASAYQVVSSQKEGLAPRLTNTNGMVNGDYYILASQYGTNTPDWYQLPMSVFQDTWRDIRIGDASIEDRVLNFVAVDDVYVKADVKSDIVDLSFGISWYNISSNKYETATYN